MIFKYFELKKLDTSIFNIFLLYGKNTGLQNEVIKKNFIDRYNLDVDSYDENEFIKDSELIISELLNKSLFDNERLIIISRVTDKILNVIKYVLEKKVKDIKIILKSGVLEKKSKLRIFFEKEKNLAVTAFYEDNVSDLLLLITDFLRKNNIKLSRESINLLIQRSSGDRGNIKNELEKIYNYSTTNKNINFETVQKLSNLAENYSVGLLADNYLLKDVKNTSKILNENNYSNDDCILILRTISNKSKRLLNIIETLAEIKNIDKVISNVRPPIFWKDKENVKKQANLWKSEDLKKILHQVNDIEILIKTNPINSVNILSNFIVSN